MNAMMIIFIVLALLFVVAFIFSRSFRTWVINEVTAITLLLRHYLPGWLANVITIIGWYSFVLICLSLVLGLLLILALLIGSPGFTGFVFVLSLGVLLLAWLPAGLILKGTGINKMLVPQGLKLVIAWIAFVGFLGLVMPEMISFKVFMGAALIALIALGVATKIKVLDKIVFPLVIIMVLVLAWQNFFPDSYRATTRYAQSWSQRVNAVKDRQSVSNEAEAATTYAVLLKDVSILYDFQAAVIQEVKVDLKAGQTLKLVNRRDEVKVYDGQGFAQVQLPKANGSFVGGKKFWVEAEFISVSSPREIIPERVSQNKKTNSKPSESLVSQKVLGQGNHSFRMKAGEISNFKILSPRFCVNTNQKDMATLVYPDGNSINLWQTAVLPSGTEFSLKSLVDQLVIIKVS